MLGGAGRVAFRTGRAAVGVSASVSRETTLGATDAEFVRFVGEIEADLERATRRLAPEGVDPADLAAEGLARAYARWDHIGSVAYRRAWVFRVVTNLALSAHSSGRRGALSLRRWATATATTIAADEHGVVDRELLRAALRKLPARQKEAVTLHYIADLTIPDVAGAMGVSSETAKTHVDRGIAALRAALGAGLDGALDA